MTQYRSSNRARNIAVAGILLAVVAVGWFFYQRAGTQPLPQPSLATVKSELAGIGPPPGASLESPATEEFRIGTTQVTQRYQLQQSAAEARDHFRTALQSHGWRLKSGDTAEVWDDSYCKAEFVAHVKLTPDASATPHVTVSILWNQISLLLCGQAATRG